MQILHYLMPVHQLTWLATVLRNGPFQVFLRGSPHQGCNCTTPTRHAVLLQHQWSDVVAVEEPKFRIVKTDGDLELRDYPGLVVAEVTVGGDRRAASSEGFRLLAGYIFGANAGSSKIAMTAPVVQSQVQGRKIAMTAPVTLAGEEGRWTVQFTMPSEYAMGDLPAPNDERVQLKSMPARRMAVLKFSGLTGDDRVASQTEMLEAGLRDHRLSPIGKPSLARYDPPWTLWFLRRNELMVSVY